MSRATLFLIVLLLLIVGGAFYLSSSAHEVPTKPIQVDVKS
jgi:hypothetical protein